MIFSCELKPDCKYNKQLNKAVECNAVLLSPATHSETFIKKAYNPITGKECNCTEDDRWMRVFYHEMEVGDTIVKNKGELFFTIHKSDTIITHYWSCNGKIYK